MLNLLFPVNVAPSSGSKCEITIPLGGSKETLKIELIGGKASLTIPESLEFTVDDEELKGKCEINNDKLVTILCNLVGNMEQ